MKSKEKRMMAIVVFILMAIVILQLLCFFLPWWSITTKETTYNSSEEIIDHEEHIDVLTLKNIDGGGLYSKESSSSTLMLIISLLMLLSLILTVLLAMSIFLQILGRDHRLFPLIIFSILIIVMTIVCSLIPFFNLPSCIKEDGLHNIEIDKLDPVNQFSPISDIFGSANYTEKRSLGSVEETELSWGLQTGWLLTIPIIILSGISMVMLYLHYPIKKKMEINKIDLKATMGRQAK